MEVIKKLAERVEKEHNQFLRDSQRLEDRSGISANTEAGGTATTSNVDFASLVGSADGATVKADTVIDSNASWDDDVWGSIFNANSVCPPIFSNDLPPRFHLQTPTPQHLSSPSIQQPSSDTTNMLSPPTLISKNTSSFQTLPSTLNPTPPKLITPRSEGTVKNAQTFPKPGLEASRPSYSQATVFPPISQSPFSQLPQPIKPAQSPSAPNYNIHFSNPIPTTRTLAPPNISSTLLMPQQFGTGHPAFPPPPQMSGLLVPSKPAQPKLGQSTNKLSKDDWGDFDPLL